MENDLASFNPKPLWNTFTITLLVMVTITVIVDWLILPATGDNSLVQYIMAIIFHALDFAIAFWAIRRDKIPWQQIGATLVKYRDAVIMFAAGLAVIATISIPIILTAAENNNLANHLSHPLTILEAWVFVGVGEEMLFRGYILTRLIHSFQRLSKFWKYCVPILISSALFAVWHIPFWQYLQSHSTTPSDIGISLFNLLYVFLFGILASYLLLRTRNILFCCLFHGLMDAPLFTLYISSGNTEWNIANFMAIGVYIIVAELYVLIQKRHRPASAVKIS